MKIFLSKISGLFLFFLFWACGSSPDNGAENNLPDSLPDFSYKSEYEKVEADTNSLVYTRYNLPLPIEMVKFLKKKEISFNREMLHSIQRAGDYETNIARAINLGFYSSDLVYCAVYERNQELVNYYSVTRKIAENLRISGGYDERTIEQLTRNMNNPDSLQIIANRSYWQVCEYLERENQINILPFVVVGGWLESMYLAYNSADTSNPEAEIMQHMAEQIVSLDNLLEYLFEVMVDSNAFYINQDIQRLMRQLKELRIIYESLNRNEYGKITDGQFRQIGHTVSKLREYYIQ